MKHTALASDILRGYVNQGRFIREKNGANASCYEAQNTATHVWSAQAEPTGAASDSAIRRMNEQRYEAKNRRRREQSHDPSAIFMLGPRARNFANQRVSSGNVCRLRATDAMDPAGVAVNWFVLASRSDAERSFVN